MSTHLFRTLLIVLALVAGGCASTSRISQSKIDDIRKGETTRRELEAMFGEPNMVSVDSEGNTWLSFTDFAINTSGSTLGMQAASIGSAFVPVPYLSSIATFGSAAVGHNSESRSTTLSVMLDADGVVKDYSFGESNQSYHTGLLGTTSR